MSDKTEDLKRLQGVVEKIAYQQTAEDQADDLLNKMGILREYVKAENERLRGGIIKLREAIDKLKNIYLVDDLSVVTPEDQFELWDGVLQALKSTALKE